MSTAKSSSAASESSSPVIASSVSSCSNVEHEHIELAADPSVIVGLACRVPGASNPTKLWDNIQAQRDLQQKMPANRFNVENFYHPDGTRKGMTNAKYGYFLDQDISHFDAGFFNISGKEAEAMDPQQRILLEVVYEALEDAGITLDQINGSRTSVYCGCFTNDYNAMTTKDLEHYPKYTVTGTGNSILANRISYFYNLHGPSATVDTACSSSLVCFHLGNQSLRADEADISIVVGSALHFDPNIFITMTDLGMLSTDGRCRAFDASGRGYVRGEGICAAVLKRQSQATSAGDAIRAIVRGTGVNHDGKKQGITLPSSEAQEALIRQTYKAAHLNPADTQYFEAHGTGTAAGDPRETRAIGAVFSPKRSEPLYVGSVKTNIGHLEGASGLAGIIKATIALQRAQIPPNMHFVKGNPEIQFKDWKIQVPTQTVDWPQSAVRRASINSFGYGGTNAHVILEAFDDSRHLMAPQPQVPPQVAAMRTERPFLAPLTSHSKAAGLLAARKFSAYLKENTTVEAVDFSHSLSVRRSHHRYRSFAIGKNSEVLAENLLNPSPIAKWIPRNDTKPRLGFIFTGQGAQWFAMGRELIERSPLFRQTLEKCDRVLQSLHDAPSWSVVEELLRSKESSKLGQTQFSQPICSALQLALVDQLKQWNIVPDAVVGHSSGEVAAAYAAGILSFENAMVAAFYRGLHMSNGSANAQTVTGSMMAVGLTEAEAAAELKEYTGRLAVAAINSPSSITISGDEDAIVELKDKLIERKVFARQLSVAQAFHSHHMYPLAPAYQSALEQHPGFQAQQGSARMFSSVTARLANPNKMGAAYWAENMTGTVRFSDALTGTVLDEADDLNVDVLVEIGPHPALKGPARQVLQSLKVDVPYVATLTRGTPDFEGLLAAAGQLFAIGYPVDLIAANSDVYLDSSGAATLIGGGDMLKDLPSYAWDHASYWAETRFIKEHRLRQHKQSILGALIPGSSPNRPRWRNILRQSELPWMVDHMIDGKVIFPAAGYLSMAIEAVARLGETELTEIKKFSIRDVSIKSALVVGEQDTGTEVILELRPVTTSAKNTSDTWLEFFICSFDDQERPQEHCIGLISVEHGAPSTLSQSKPYRTADQLWKESNRSIGMHKYYQRLAARGLGYGEFFRLLTGDVQSGPGFATAPLSWQVNAKEADSKELSIIHPAFLDASIHVAFAAIESQLGKDLDEPFVPTFIRSLNISGLFQSVKASSEELRVRSSVESRLPGPRVAINDVRVESEDCNQLLIDVTGLELTALGSDASSDGPGRSLFFRTRWQPAFDVLKDKEALSCCKSISALLDVYAHQHPNAKILNYTTTQKATEEILQHLGGRKGQRRRFNKLTAWNPSDGRASSLKALQDQWPGLVQIQDPTGSTDFDLVVLSSHFDLDFLPFLKSDGILISLQSDFSSTALTPVFRTPDYSVWRKTPFARELSGPITILTSSQASTRTEKIVAELEFQYDHSVVRKDVSTAASSEISRNVIVLASLDESLLFQDESAQDYEVVQSLLTSEDKNITWVLEGALMECSRPEHAIIFGLARSARSENDRLSLKILDVADKADSRYISSRVLQVLEPSFYDDEVADRNGVLFVPRVEADDVLNSKLPNGVQRDVTIQPLKQDRPLALKFGKAGLLETLAFGDDVEILDTELADDELEIEVKASAINFRDIAASMGIIDDYRLGDECAGLVVRKGSKVLDQDFAIGDRVVAWRPGQGAHRTLVRNPAPLCFRLGEMPFAAAAALPLILTTAHYSLMDVARLQPGETVLIHSAAGGVGQMAIQVAQMVGANVIATVGSQMKRDLLKESFGLADEQIFSSRDESFVDGVMSLTDRRGVDVALNSLAGKLLHATWGCIAPFGRFIEIGKRDIHENSKIDMDPFRRNVMFASVDLVTMFEKNKKLGAKVFQECCDLVHHGHIQPPQPITEVSYAEVQRGFRLLQMGKVTGKVVLVPGDNDMVPVQPSSYRNKKILRSDKTYLLVGGLGGLGRSLSEWLVRKGAHKLAFLSRSGADKAEARATVNWLEDRNITVSVYRGDITDASAVSNCINAIGSDLAGIFQAAMVLQDAPYDQLTYQKWQTCVRPKVLGTWNLHNATLRTPLDFFICFSSVSAILGSKGQANYSAANSYQDSLMRHRREQGLKGTTMNCGMIVGVGAVAENAALQTVMERIGYDPVNEEELLHQIEEAINADGKHAGNPCQVDNHQIITGVNLAKEDLYWSQKPLFRNLYANHDFNGSAAEAQTGQNLPTLLRAASTLQERAAILCSAFIDKIASVLAVPAELIQPGDPLSSYGLDSIVAVEFRKWFAKSVRVDLALFDILKAKSISSLVTKATELMVLDSSEAGAKTENGAATTKDNQNTGSQKPSEQGLSSDIMAIQRPKNIPMSTFQGRFWFAHMMTPDRSVLNLPIYLHIAGKPQVSVLEAALNELVRRNDILRTRYFEGDEFAEQEVIDDCEIEFIMKDLSSHTDPAKALEAYGEELRQEELDIETGEVLRTALVKLSDARHCLIMIMHHISIDRGSSKSFLTQLTGIYDALVGKGNLVSVPTPQISYSDFTLWHKNLLQTQAQEDIKFWKQKMLDAPASSKLLPFAKAERPAQNDFQRAAHHATLSSTIHKRMKRISSRIGVTSFQFLLAAFRTFLYRYTGEKDMTILMIDGNRPHPELDDVLGFFVNMVPIRFVSDCEVNFDQALEDCKASTLEALEHNRVPFDAIVDALGVEKNPSFSPLGQIVVNYQMHGTMPTYPTADFDIHRIVSEDIPSACEMNLEAIEAADSALNIRLEYSTTLYGDGDVERFLDNFTTYLTDVVKDHRQPVNEIQMCGSKEIKNLESNFWNTEFIENRWDNVSVLERISHQCTLHPRHPAISTSEGDSISYSSLMEKSQSLAFALSSAGAAPGQLLGLYSKPGIDAITGMVATLIVGCGYVSMDPDFAQDRLAFMASDAKTDIIMYGPGLEVDARNIAERTGLACQLLDIAVESNRQEKLSNTNTSPNDPFYVIYTSGSTGKPKGVVLTESNTQAMLSTLQHDYKFIAKDRFLHHSSICFDLSVVQIFSALTAGATVCVAAAEVRKDPVALAEYMQQSSITVSYFTPTLMALLLEFADATLRKCVDYRVAFFAGETLPPRVAKAFYALETPAAIYNTWSPSELVVQTTIEKVDPSTLSDEKIPIGHPMANMRHYIVDDNCIPVPAGIVGEIVVGGPQVGRGYMNRPDANTKSFLVSPCCSDEDRSRGWTRVFRTGDRGRFRPDGRLEFHGRVAGDKQVKLRGFRIDLTEIENHLFAEAKQGGFSGLIDLSVIARAVNADTDTLMDNRQLIAYLVPSEAIDASQQKRFVTYLHEQLGKSLNAYMLPSGYQFLERLPVTIGGKVDRQNLLHRSLELTFPSTETSDDNATKGECMQEGIDSAILQNIVDLFKEILKLPSSNDVSPLDNFFKIGGSSILLVRFQAKLKKVFGKAPALPELFKAPTAEGITQMVQRQRRVTTGDNSKNGQAQKVDWSKEAALPKKQRWTLAAGKESLSRSKIRHVLVTGVDSYIGVHMLATLVADATVKTIYLLGSNRDVTYDEMFSVLDRYQLISQDVSKAAILEKTRLVPGNLKSSRFGLGNQDFQQLGESIQAIYHLGGSVSLLKSYDDLKPMNVDAALDIIELAGLGKTVTEIHHLSTWSVPHLQTWADAHRTQDAIVVDETSAQHFQPEPSKQHGYFKSRWVSEMLMTQAAERGFPVSIYRAAAVSGSMGSAAPEPHEDFIRQMVRTMIAFRSTPKIGTKALEFAVDFIPVDHLTSSLLRLSTASSREQQERTGKPDIFHIGNVSPLPLSKLAGMMSKIRQDGRKGRPLPLDSWLEVVSKDEDPDAQMRFAVLKDYFTAGHNMFALDRTKTAEVLSRADAEVAVCPPVDQIEYLRYLFKGI